MSIEKARMAARKALERMYQGRATVIEYQKIKDEWGMTNFQEVTVLEDQPCKLSFETLTSSTGDPVATVSQSVKLFISPDVVIKAGSKIIVTQHGRTTEYSNSGVPAVYPTHQEIMLTLFEGWHKPKPRIIADPGFLLLVRYAILKFKRG